MRRGFTLIELIFTIVIIGVVFTVIPKIIFSVNRGFELSVKEEALYMASAFVGHISTLAWDENTINRDGKILDANGVECNSSTGPHKEGFYRVGGFIGSRNCIGWQNSSDWKPTDSIDLVNGYYNDIDDYNGYSEEVDGKRENYKINVNVIRDRDIKKVIVKISSSNSSKGSFSSSFIYESANIGWSKINSKIW